MPFPDHRCTACPLEHLGEGFCKPDGRNELGVALAGEALGADEVAAGGLPFQGKAGNVLTRLIERTKDPITGAPLSRYQFTIGNVVSCRPVNNELVGTPYELEAIARCRPNMEAWLKDTKPKAILAMGRTPLFALTGLGHQKKYGIEHWRGSVLESPYGWVIPTLHPSYIMRGNFRYAQVFINDLLRAVYVARHGLPQNRQDYTLYPDAQSIIDFRDKWRLAGRPPLGFDIETPYSPGASETELEEVHLEETLSYQIVRISFSFEGGTAITMPWEPPFVELALALLEEAPELTVWNEPFDVPRLMAAGARFPGQIVDAMVAFHRCYPSFDYGLQNASSLIIGHAYRAWKHENNSQPEHYSAQDSDYLIRCYKHVREKLEQDGEWARFVRHFVTTGAVLRKMSATGVPTNAAKRATERAKLEARLEGLVKMVQTEVPPELRPSKVYKITEERLTTKFGVLTAPLWTSRNVPLTVKESERLAKRHARDYAKWEKAVKRADKKGQVPPEAPALPNTSKKEWLCLLEWNPGSPQQVLEYLTHCGYPIPKNRKTRKPTSGEEAIEKILRKHPTDPVLPLVLEYRHVQKAKGYLDDALVGADGRFHPEWTRHPETLRYSCRRPNLQNQPKGLRKSAEAELAQAILSTIEAPPGWVLVERDFKAQEALLVGFFADDVDYMRLARLGIYSFFVARKVGQVIDLTLPDGPLKKQLSAIKAAHPSIYAVMKKTILARNYGETVPAIAKDLEPFFLEEAKTAALETAAKKSWWKEVDPAHPLHDGRVTTLVANFTNSLAKAAAMDYVTVYEAAAPKVVQWQKNTRIRAHKEGKLTNPFGYCRHWYDVLTPKKGPDGKPLRNERGERIMVPGSEGNKALAFLAQSSGAGIMSECLVKLDEQLGKDPDFLPIITEHDKVVALAREEKKDFYLGRMCEIMEAPIPELGGLVIETEGKWGRNWAEMQEAD